jgi:hypothetical protein
VALAIASSADENRQPWAAGAFSPSPRSALETIWLHKHRRLHAPKSPLGGTDCSCYHGRALDQNLLRSYFETVYELPTDAGVLRASMDGEIVKDIQVLPALLRSKFALLTAYNPRSMLLPRRVNEGRHMVMRDLLILGCYRVEHCVGYDEEPEGVWREPAWLVHGVERDEALIFGRTFRQNTIIYCRDAKPELIVTDPTCDDIGKVFSGNWRLRS